MTRARATMLVDAEWLHEQVPGATPAQLVEFALHKTTVYGDFASQRSSSESRETKSWFDEAKARNLKLVGEMFPELADECRRQIEAVGWNHILTNVTRA